MSHDHKKPSLGLSQDLARRVADLEAISAKPVAAGGRPDLPDDAAKLLLEMADQVRSINLKLVDMTRRLDDAERLLSGMGAVTLDDLIKRGAA